MTHSLDNPVTERNLLVLPFESFNGKTGSKNQANVSDVGERPYVTITLSLSRAQIEHLRSQLDFLKLPDHPIPGFIKVYDAEQFATFKRRIIANFVELFDTFEPIVHSMLNRAVEVKAFTTSCQEYALSLVKERHPRDAVREIVSLLLRAGCLGMQILYEHMTREQRLTIFLVS